MKRPRQASMFDHESVEQQSLVQVLADRKPQGKAQATFQQLIAKIEARRAALQKWQVYLQRYHERLADEYMPLQAQLRAGKRRLAEAIDALLCQPAKGRTPGKQQRYQFEDILLDLLDELIDEDEPDEAIVALFDRYSDVSYAELQADEREIMEAMAKNIPGVASPERPAAASNAEGWEQEQQRLREAFEAAAREHAHKRGPAAARKAEAARAKAEQAAREVKQSIRDIYRKLASALHPDREPDPDERRRKTQLIQRVNQAYEANDLLTLLGLQLEIEQIDAEHLGAVPPERLAHYNQVLRDQLTDLDVEIDDHVFPFREMLGHLRRPINPALVDQHLTAELDLLRRAISDVDVDIVELRDPKQLAGFLKRYSLQTREEEIDMDELADMLAVFEEAGAAPGKRKRRR